MTYLNRKTRPGGQPDNHGPGQILYLRALLTFENVPTCDYLRERISNMRQLWLKIDTALYPLRSFAGGVR